MEGKCKGKTLENILISDRIINSFCDILSIKEDSKEFSYGINF